MTFEEFERLPEYEGKQELLDGELIELPPADLLHSRIMRLFFLRLHVALSAAHGAGQAKELGEVYPETGYKLPGDRYVIPDVSVAYAAQAASKYLEGAPAIAIEIVSPSNTARLLDAKTRMYCQLGALEVWIVYPETKHVVVHSAEGIRDISEDASLTTPLIPGFELPVREMLAA